MTEKSQTHSAEFDTEKARETAEAFMTLWQQRWHEMMQQNGWPTDMQVPNMGQMPFMSPFMGGFGQGFSQSSDAARIDALEKRIAALEKQLKSAAAKRPIPSRTKPAPKTRNAGAAQKKPARKHAKG